MRNTTALVTVVMLFLPVGARANLLIINSATPYAGPLLLGSDESLIVANASSITSGNTTVQANSVIAGSIDNSGTITGGSGIRALAGGDFSNGITNESGGTIVGGGYAGIVIVNTNLSGGILNNGVIFGSYVGIVSVEGNVSGGIINDGKITSNNDGIDCRSSSDISGGITNESGGTIDGGVVGIFVGYGGSISGGIINKGFIHGNTSGIDANSYGLISGGITNESGGIISGDIGINISNSSSSITGGITNESGATIIGTGGTAISLSGLTGSTPILINGGHIIGDVVDDAPANGFLPVTIGGDFTTQGNFNVSSVSIAAGKTLEVSTGNTITTRTLTTAGGTLTLGVTSAATHGEMVLTNGGATLTGEAIKVDVTGGNTLANGDKILIIEGTAPLVGGPGGTPVNVADNSALWNFQIVDGTGAGVGGNGDELYLEATAVTPPVTPPPNPKNQQVETVLQSLSATSDPQLAAIINNYANAPSSEDAKAILEAAQPTVDESTVTSALNFSDDTFNLTETRLSSLREGDDETGMAAGDLSHGVGAWGQVFDQHVDQKARDNIAGYVANTFGGAVGVDTRNISDRLIAGLALSYGRTDANSNNANTTKTEIYSYQATLYGNYDFSNETYIDGQAAYGWNQDNTTRHNVGGIAGLNAEGSFHASQIAAQAEAGRNYDVGDTTLTPNVLAHWVNYSPDSYTETGAGGANLHVHGNSMNQVELGVGLKAGWILEDGAGSLIKPQLRAGYRYAVVNDAVEDTSAFTGGGGTFTTQGAAPARSSVNLGGTIKLDTTNNWEFTASYDLDYRADYLSNAGFIRAAYKF